MRKALLLILLLLSSFTALSRDFKVISRQTIDSLLKLLPGAGTKEQFFILNSVAEFYAPLNFDSSIIYASQAIRLATTRSNSFDVALVKINIGNAYYYKMDFKNALVSYLSAQSILEKGPYFNELGKLSLMLGHINFFIMRGEKAISYYRKALGYFLATGNDASISWVYDAMGLTMSFLNSEPVDSALNYGFKQLNYARQHCNRYLEARALSDIGMFYAMEGASVPKKQKALVYCDSALKLATRLNFTDLISVINLNLGGYYDRSSPLFDFTGDLAVSRRYYEKALSAARQIGSIYLQTIILNYLAEIDIEEGKYNEASVNLGLSETLLNLFFQSEWKKTTVDVGNPVGKIFEYFLAQRERTALYNARFKLAMAKGEYQKAVTYFQRYYQFRDTMNASQQGKQFELLIAEDESEKQAQKIRALAQDNELNQLKLSRSRFLFFVSGAGIALVSIILLLFFQRRRLKAEQRSVSMEQRLLRAQMNPHFIFNSLASIQNFVINENSDQASIYLSRFSQLVRNILDNSTEEYVPLEKEVSTIENYLELQKVRYTGKFEYKITVDEKIDAENVLIPPMLAQPFIENAIEHGIRHKERSGHIEVNFRLNDGFIRVEVEDDGVGREKALEIESKQKIRHRSMAISITRDRLDILNRKLKKKIRMEIIDLKDDYGESIGTRVEFGIPVVGR
jgi:hypothetical protein